MWSIYSSVKFLIPSSLFQYSKTDGILKLMKPASTECSLLCKPPKMSFSLPQLPSANKTDDIILPMPTRMRKICCELQPTGQADILNRSLLWTDKNYNRQYGFSLVQQCTVCHSGVFPKWLSLNSLNSTNYDKIQK